MTNVHRSIVDRLPLLICLSAAALPFLAVHLAYLVAASHGYVDWCNPYIDSCTSISATGRHPPASFIFRGIMLPSAMLILMFWWLHWRWLSQRGVGGRSNNAMLLLGALACLGLILYVTVLGESGQQWRLQRRIGTILFFSFTFLAQLLLAAQLRRMSADSLATAATTGKIILRLCTLMLSVGIFSVIVQLISEDWHDAIEDAIEWLLALLLQANFLLGSRLWWNSPWWLAFVRGGRLDCGSARNIGVMAHGK